MRIVHKTNDVEEFDQYKVWVNPETPQIKVSVYNTLGSHRSKPFEYRTGNIRKKKIKSKAFKIKYPGETSGHSRQNNK